MQVSYFRPNRDSFFRVSTYMWGDLDAIIYVIFVCLYDIVYHCDLCSGR